MAAITLASGVSAWVDETSLVLFGRNEWPYYDGVPDRDPYRILPEVRERLLAIVGRMDPAAFEEMLGRLLAEMGFDQIEVTKYHGDKGIDVRGTLIVTGGIPIRMAIQAKRWKNSVQAPEVQKVRGASAANERAMIIATSSFGAGARAEAERVGFPPVGLIDGKELVGLMIEHGIGVTRGTFDVIGLDEAFELTP